MKTSYIWTLSIIFALGLFSLLSLVKHVEQQAEINATKSERDKHKTGWCDVQIGNSHARVECEKINRLEAK